MNHSQRPAEEYSPGLWSFLPFAMGTTNPASDTATQSSGKRKSRRIIAIVCAGAAGLTLVARFANSVAIAFEGADESVSVGTPSRGALRHGRRLPTTGPNFTASSWLATALGRNSVHRRVRDAALRSYDELARTVPERQWMYAEAGWPRGGRFRPHHTHQNGLSIDFVVPVRSADGRVAELNSWVGNLWTYAIEFDGQGRSGDHRIDFEAMARHLDALDRHARACGLRVERVIFDPAYHSALFATPTGRLLRERVPFMQRRAWVRHDEHYHVDFVLLATAPAR